MLFGPFQKLSESSYETVTDNQIMILIFLNHDFDFKINIVPISGD